MASSTRGSAGTTHAFEALARAENAGDLAAVRCSRLEGMVAIGTDTDDWPLNQAGK